MLRLVMFFLSALTIGGCSVGDATPTQPKKEVIYKKLTPAEAKEMLYTNQDIILLDVRTLPEFEEIRIDGSILIPDYEIGSLAPQILTDKDKTILVYCRSGRRSKAAAEKLISLGYTDVYDIGGIVSWPYETVSSN